MIESGIKFKLNMLCFLAFFASLIQNIYTPIIPKLQEDFHVSIFWINASVGIFIFIVAVMQIFLGRNIDSKDTKKALLFGIGIVILSSLVCALTKIFIVFAVFRLLQAIGCGIIPLVTLTLLAKLSTSNDRASVMANYQIFLSTAPALAPILGSIIGAKWSYHGIFIFLFVISLLLFFMVYFTAIPNVKKKHEKISEKLENYYLADKVFISLVILGYMVFYTYFSILVYLPVLLSHSYNISDKMIGFLFLPITISTILGSMFYKKLSKKQVALTILQYTTFLFAIFTLLFGLFNSRDIIILSLIIFMLGLLVGGVPPLLSTLISKRYENINGKVLGVFNFVRYIGMTMGAIAVGLVSQSYLYFYCTVISIILGILFIYIRSGEFKQSLKV